MEKTLVLLKPDCFQLGLREEIIRKIRNLAFSNSCLEFDSQFFISLSRHTIEKHYIEHKDKHFFNDLCEFMTSGPVEAFIFEGDNCVKIIRKIAMEIRQEYPTQKERNLIHSSDSVESANREIDIFFDKTNPINRILFREIC